MRALFFLLSFPIIGIVFLSGCTINNQLENSTVPELCTETNDCNYGEICQENICISIPPANNISCDFDTDCVPEQCCHPTSCINQNYRTVCTELCTQVCQGPIDCGAGRCECVNNECTVVPNLVNGSIPVSETYEIFIINYTFNPEEKNITAGDTIVWVNQDSVYHSIFSDTNMFASDSIAPGGNYSHTFEVSGTFDYHCSLHPNMKGTIIVG